MGLFRAIAPSDEIERVSKFDNFLLFGAKQNALQQIFFNLFQYFSDPKNGRSCRGDCTGQGGPGSRGQVSRFAETDVVLCCVVSDRLLRWLRQMPCCVVSAFVAHLSLSLGC